MIQCQNLNWISPQTTGVVHLASNFIKHLVKVFKHDLLRKRNILRTFAPSTTQVILFINHKMLLHHLHKWTYQPHSFTNQPQNVTASPAWFTQAYHHKTFLRHLLPSAIWSKVRDCHVSYGYMETVSSVNGQCRVCRVTGVPSLTYVMLKKGKQ
jgi:hypothetical protein